MPSPLGSNHCDLLISLGTSPAVVPEAFLLPGVCFRAVHVLTTEKPNVQLIRDYFAAHAPGVRLTLSRVAGFNDFASESDHFQFEEILYRWVLASAPDPSARFFCLSGGFKTMSAAMQKAAAVLGAAEVFHVLADAGSNETSGPGKLPSTIAEIQRAAENGRLKWIHLGRESGWPQFRSAVSGDYPLVVIKEAETIRWLGAADSRFRKDLQTALDRSHHIAEAWHGLADLPFVELATWSAADLNWLREPLQPQESLDQEWVRRLPKVELHCHLGGFATEGELLHQVRAAATNPEQLPSVKALDLPCGWPFPCKPIGLEAYRMLGHNNGSSLLRDPGCLRRQCELLYDHLVAQGIVYAEVRCSPANYADPTQNRSPWIVLSEIRSAFQSAQEQAIARRNLDPNAPPACHVNLLIIGTRQNQGDFRAGISRHLALAVTASEHWRDPASCRVVGVDLAGYEDVHTRAHYFREEFVAIHRCGVALTVHAGENDEAEGIWRAVFDLNTRRLGHALSLAQSPDLLRSVIDRGIAIEMCPCANLQIKGFQPFHQQRDDGLPAPPYPLLQYLRAGVRATVNTDNPGISGADLGANLLLAAKLCPGLTRLDLLWLQRHALDAAFVPVILRQGLGAAFCHLPLP